MRRRTFLKGTAALAAASAGGFLMPGDARAATVPFLPYSGGAFFRSPVAGAPVDSAATAAFQSFMRTHVDQKAISWPKITGVGSNPWGTTFAAPASTDPIWRIAAGSPGVRPETAILQTQGFHMADAVADRIPTGTQDRPFLIVDQAFGYSLFCGDVVPNKAARTITVGQAALFWHSSNGLDKRNPRTDDTRNWASRGRIPDSTVIRRDVLNAAMANGTGLGYVLEMFFVETDGAAGFCHPMVGCETRQQGWGAEGTRIAIRPDVNLPARGLTGGALALARTLQEHGCYLGDNSGSSSTLKGEQSSPTYNPWAGTNVSTNCLQGKITWADFYVLPRGWQ